MGNQHWVECRFGDVINIRNGYAFKSKDFKKKGDVPIIKQTQLDGEKVNLDNCVFVDKRFLKEKSDFLLKKGDVLLGMSGSLGKFCVYDLDEPALQNQRTGKIEPISVGHLENRFYWHYLQTIEVQLKEKGKGLGVSNVSADDIEDLPFPLPPLPEQKRIVEKLDTILPKVKNAISRLDNVPRILKRFRQSVLAAACSGKLTEDWRGENPAVETAEDQLRKILDLRILDKRYKAYLAKINDLESPIEWAEEDDMPSSWFKSKLGVVCPKITDGTHDTPKRLKEGVPYITGKHIRERVIDFEHCDYVSPDDHKVIYARCNPNKNDVLMVNIGAGTATPALVKVDYEFSMKNVALLKTDSSIISGSYLEYYQLRCKDYIFNQVTKGGAQPFLSLDAIKALPIHLPPREEQVEIVRRVEKLFKLADSLEAKYAKAMERVQKIEQSVLAKAFRGELAPQGPNDEPAEELLKRILAEKAKLEAVKKKSKRFSPQRDRHS